MTPAPASCNETALVSNLAPGSGPPAGPERRRVVHPPATQRLLLTVSADESGGWTARAELADGTVRLFASPFELARFVARVRELPASRTGLR